MTTTLFSAQNSWLRYFTELSSVSSIPTTDNPSNPSNITNAHDEGEPSGTIGVGPGQPDFETILQNMIAEYGATRDHLEILEKKLVKMLDIKEARMRTEYESAKRRLQASERENKLVREIIRSTPSPIDMTRSASRARSASAMARRVDMHLDDDELDHDHDEDEDETIKARPRKADIGNFDLPNHDTLVEDEDRDLPLPSLAQRAQATLDQLSKSKDQLAAEEKARAEAENAQKELQEEQQVQQLAAAAAAEAQAQVDLAQARLTLKNEEAARKTEEGLRRKEETERRRAEEKATLEERARYIAEQEVQRLRAELKLVQRDRAQTGTAKGAGKDVPGVPFFAVGGTTDPERRDQWLEGRTPEELVELQNAVSRALTEAQTTKRKAVETKHKRKLSKRVRSNSTDVRFRVPSTEPFVLAGIGSNGNIVDLEPPNTGRTDGTV